MSQTAIINQNYSPEILLQKITGAWVTQSIYVVAKLGIADLLKNGAKSSDELAKLTGVDAESLYRVLRALSSDGLFSEGENRQFQLTPLAQYLQTDFPGSLRAFAIFLGEPWHMQVWGNFFHSVETGTSTLEHLYGVPFHSYLAQDSQKSEVYNQAMTDLTSSLIPAVLASYDFSSISKIVDVGGGHGILLSEILKKNPTMKGILFDQLPVVEGARPLLEAQGVIERCELVAGNFFESVPSGGDAYLMKHIIHGPNVEGIQSILNNCHQAMPENAKLLILEKVIAPENKPSFSKWIDLQLLLASNGGRERTETEYGEILAAAGFKLTKVIYTNSPVDVIEAVKI